jgi:hypothetical protein
LVCRARRHLLSFDADGAGPRAAAVIAVLPGWRRVPLAAIWIVTAR